MSGDLFRDLFEPYKDSYSGTVLVKTGREVLFSAAAGLANRDHGVPNRLDTKFDTASVTKVFTAIAVLLLAERGLLRLDERITDVVDLGGTMISKDVTIEQLLNHTSGIADDADEEAGEAYEALFVDKPNYSIRNCADFLPQFAHKPPLFAPGTDVRYNNCAFVLLGLAIERRTGMDYRSFVVEHILKPCELRDTAFLAKDEVCPNAAEGYFGVYDDNGALIKWKKNIYSYPPIGTPDGGIYTTVSDLDALLRAVKDGQLLSTTGRERLFSPHCAFTRPARNGTWRMGYAFEFIERDGAPFCLYKDGGNPGVDAMFSYYPQHDLTVNLLSNQDGPLTLIHRAIQSAIAQL